MASASKQLQDPLLDCKTQMDVLLEEVGQLSKKQINISEARRKIQLMREQLNEEQETSSDKNPSKLQKSLSIDILEKAIAHLEEMKKVHQGSTNRIQSKRLWLQKKRKLLFKTMEKDLRIAKRSEQFSIRNVLQEANYKAGFIGQSSNSQQIQRCLNDYVGKIFKNQSNNPLLNYLSEKHKVYFNKKMMNYGKTYGLKNNDFRKVNKYQVITSEVPQMSHNYEKVRKVCADPNFSHLQIQQKQELPSKEIQSFDEYPTFDQKTYQVPEDNVFRTAWRKLAKNLFKTTKTYQKQKFQKISVLKRLAVYMVREVSNIYQTSIKQQKDYTNRARRLYKQTAVYWRRKEKQLIEVKKKKQKLEAQMKKKDQQEKQKVLQSKRLQFLMKQSQLYAHFMSKKLGTQSTGQAMKQEGKPQIQIDDEAMKLNFSEMMNEQQQKAKARQNLDLSAVNQQTQNSLINVPSSFKGQLKQYQIKGLRWLDNLHQQAINGILADQMGLGKTIQAIALLSHISQTKGIWGPFLIVSPSSTLFNWQQELQKFCPSLRVLPYWGNLKQRKMIRKFFNNKKFSGTVDSPFHVVITSYQLIVSDEKSFHRLKWAYIVLDEAQAIKNVSSQRWTTLMSFHAQNKLLLTGTPIQNTMAELWALLHFIMPTLFDSHQQFQEWFSKDIEAHSQDQKALNQHQIQRLHGILKPFMLRRVKKDVEHEIGKKIEQQIVCQMTKRQQLLYDSIKQKLNLKDYFKMADSKLKVQNLMNLVMQLRKVCNHPELFERRPSKSPYLFQTFKNYTGHQPIRNKLGEEKCISFVAENPIALSLPKLVYDNLLEQQFERNFFIEKTFNAFTPLNILKSQGFSWASCMGMNPSHVSQSTKQHPLALKILLAHWLHRSSSYISKLSTKESIYFDQPQIDQNLLIRQSPLSNLQIFIPPVTAPHINIKISSQSFYNQQQMFYRNQFLRQVQFGNSKQNKKEEQVGMFDSIKVPIQVVNFDSLVADSTKLRQLSRLLKQKHENGDRVLIFSQMTKMLDILEDFMIKKRYTFFRLDGSLNIADRRDMVNQFQKNDKIFAFLLSTRAGGLGITLTAANTVIFYDNDWNPTMDAQATDRAHRIGQNRDVYVYRMMTKNTIEQRIVKRAQQKQTVQSTVYDGATAKPDVFKPQDILNFILDENELQKQEAQELMNKLGKVKDKGKKIMEQE